MFGQDEENIWKLMEINGNKRKNMKVIGNRWK